MIDNNNETSVLTAGYDNLRVFDVSIETILKRGLFQFDIVGLASKTVSESKQRILSAIQSCKLDAPRYTNKKIITLLSPADDKKEGSHFDLPIAVSYLIANGVIEASFLKDIYIFGELTLRGSLRKAKNIDLILSQIDTNSTGDIVKHIIIPKDQNIHINDYRNLSFLVIDSIQELILSIQTSQNQPAFLDKFSSAKISDIARESYEAESETDYLIDSIEGLDFAKRALLISLAGKHHIVFIGPPGVGKSMLAKASAELIVLRGVKIPFKEPHHTSSYSTLVGYKKHLGEIALAHNGILYFDEVIEFNRRVLESLRQPLEDGYIIHPELGKLESDFIFIGTMNPCGCGYKNLESKKCVCSPSQISRYNRKIQSPLFERILIKVNIFQKDIKTDKEDDARTNPKTVKLSSKDIVSTIKSVREIQDKREKSLFELETNSKTSKLSSREILTSLKIRKAQQSKKNKENILKDSIKSTLSSECKRILNQFMEVNNASKRLEKSILLLSRTIADVENSAHVLEVHILEAINYASGNFRN